MGADNFLEGMRRAPVRIAQLEAEVSRLNAEIDRLEGELESHREWTRNHDDCLRKLAWLKRFVARNEAQRQYVIVEPHVENDPKMRAEMLAWLKEASRE